MEGKPPDRERVSPPSPPRVGRYRKLAEMAELKAGKSAKDAMQPYPCNLGDIGGLNQTTD